MIPLGFLLKKGASIQKSHGFYWRSWKETKFVLKTFLWKQQSLKKILEERKIIPMHFSLKKGFWIQKSHGFCLDDKSFEKKGFVLKTSLWKHQSWTKQKKLFKEKVSMDFYFKERCLEPKNPMVFIEMIKFLWKPSDVFKDPFVKASILKTFYSECYQNSYSLYFSFQKLLK